jgi:hypothetical protein
MMCMTVKVGTVTDGAVAATVSAVRGTVVITRG